MSELKKCPFCGGEIKQMFMDEESFVECVWDESVGEVATWFKCYGCDSEFFHDDPIETPEKQVEWWNTRKSMERIVEQINAELDSSEKFMREYDDSIAQRAYYSGMNHILKIVKEEGGMNEHFWIYQKTI